MSLFDKVVSAVTPPESESARAEARAKATAAAGEDDWLSMAIHHHQEIEAAFAAVKAASDVGNQVKAQKWLATILTGHAIAEEAVLYPALVKSGEEGHSATAYTEQSAAKVQMALLEDLTPMSQDYRDKLEHIRGAVAHHVYEEESNWFLDIKKQLTAEDQLKLTFKYREQFMRYMGDNKRNDFAAGLDASATVGAHDRAI